MVSFSPTGAQFASASQDGTARLWDARSGASTPLLHRDNDVVASVTFSPKGSSVVSGSPDSLRVWDTSSGSLSYLLLQDEVPSGGVVFRSLNFSPDGSRLVSFSTDGAARLWEFIAPSSFALKSQFRLPRKHQLPAVIFSPDGSHLSYSYHDTLVTKWDFTETVTSSSYAMPNSKDFTIEYLPTAHINPPSLTGFLPVVQFSQDGSFLASVSNDGTILLQDRTCNSAPSVLDGSSALVASIAFSPDGTVLASGFNDNTIRLWSTTYHPSLDVEIDSGVAAHPVAVTAVIFSPDGSQVASGSSDALIQLWDGASGSLITVLDGHTAEINRLAFSPNNKLLASGSKEPDNSILRQDGAVRVWNAVTYAIVFVFNDQAGTVTFLKFSSDSSQLACGFERGTIQLWDLDAGFPIVSLNCYSSMVASLEFSIDDSYLRAQSRSGEFFTVDLFSNSIVRTATHPRTASDSVPSYPPPLSMTLQPKFYITNRWLFFHPSGEEPIQVCRIPEEYEFSTSLARNGLMVAIGCRRGQLLVLDVSNHPSVKS